MPPSPIPHGRTARRLEWAHLPPAVRAAIEERLRRRRSRSAASQNGGFTPGFASVLECEDGSRHFVKAASTKAQRMFAEAYREEARKLAALPDAAPGPAAALDPRRRRLVRALDRVRRRAAAAPPLAAGRSCSSASTRSRPPSPVLTPPPAELALPPASEEFAEWPAYWDHLRAARPGPAAPRGGGRAGRRGTSR